METKPVPEAVAQEMPSREQMLADLRSAEAPSRAPASMPSREQMLADLRKEESLASQVEAISQRKKKELEARPKKKAPEVKYKPTLDVLPKEFTRNDILRYLFETDKIAGLTPGTAAGQVDVESDFNPNAVSNKGAKGLAQIIPSTVKSLSERFGRKLDPLNPSDNLFMQREVLKENMAKFKNENNALRAYNAGWDKEAWTRTPEALAYLGKVKLKRKKYKTPPKGK